MVHESMAPVSAGVCRVSLLAVPDRSRTMILETDSRPYEPPILKVAMAILSERSEYSAEAHGVGDPEVVIDVHGDVDQISASGLASLISEVMRWGAPQRLVIDLSDVGIFGSNGVHVLIAARRQLFSEFDLVVRSPNRLTRRVLEVTGLGNVCHIEG